MSPGVLGAVVNAQSGELTALLGGGEPDEVAVVDPASLPILAQAPTGDHCPVPSPPLTSSRSRRTAG